MCDNDTQLNDNMIFNIIVEILFFRFYIDHSLNYVTVRNIFMYCYSYDVSSEF